MKHEQYPKFLKIVSIVLSVAILMVSLLIFIVLFSSCGYRMNDTGAMAATTFFAVPSAGVLDLKEIDEIFEEIDRDEYGRVLFLYRGYCELIKKEEAEILIIYQKHDDDYVYYYEDMCYMFATPSSENINIIKERNDWGIPLDESKMSRRQVRVSFGGYLRPMSDLKEWKIKQILSKELGVDIHTIIIDDVSPSKQEAYFVVLKNADASSPYYDYAYYIIVDPSYQIRTMKIDSFEEFLQKLRPFKQECGWHYGT